jgi:hypothetical protein
MKHLNHHDWTGNRHEYESQLALFGLGGRFYVKESHNNCRREPARWDLARVVRKLSICRNLFFEHNFVD